MKPETLESVKETAARLSETDVYALGAFCVQQGDKLNAERQRNALQEIATKEADLAEWKKTYLLQHGIAPEEKKAGAKRKAAKPAFVPKAGHIYQRQGHPNVTAKGTGVRPDWWHEDIAGGKLPVDLGPVVTMPKAS